MHKIANFFFKPSSKPKHMMKKSIKDAVDAKASSRLLLRHTEQASVDDEKEKNEGVPKGKRVQRLKKRRAIASAGGSVSPATQWWEDEQAQSTPTEVPNIRLIVNPRRGLSAIKLKRTDTTLDLSQMAKRAKEKRKRNCRKEASVICLERMPGKQL